MAKKVKQKTKAGGLKSYFASIDFGDWWEDFSLSVNKNGTPRYKTVHSFIKTKARNKQQLNFLWWILGPKVDLKEGTHEFQSWEQFDWEEKRANGFWGSSKNTENLRAEVKRRHSSMDAVRAMGQINIEIIAQLQAVSIQLDKEYAGGLLLPNLSATANEARLDLYLKTKARIQEMVNEAQLMFSRTQGIDMQKIEAFLAIAGTRIMDQLAGVSTNSSDGSGPRPAMVKAAEQFTQMLAAKATDYNLALPKGVEEDLKDKPKIINMKKPN